MFIPRAVRLKGARESSRPKKPAKAPAKKPALPTPPADIKSPPVESAQTTADSPAPQQKTEPIQRGPRYTTAPVTPEYIAQLAAGVGLIFTDYAHQEPSRAQWLAERWRIVDGQEKYIHLSAVLSHPAISTLKPAATHALLQRALRDHPSRYLELSQNEYYIRRRPDTFPAPFAPPSAFTTTYDTGLSFWDARTIYVEPHHRSLCQTPARVAHHLAAHGGLREKWLPIQAVHKIWNGCGFVVLSGNVTHADAWEKWRESTLPADWKVMTKVEHSRRTAEYLALLKKENPNGMRKADTHGEVPAIERPAVFATSKVDIQEPEAPKGKRKRKRQKGKKNKGALVGEHVGEDDEDGDDEANKKRRT